jgi:hypothetical protein
MDKLASGRRTFTVTPAKQIKYIFKIREILVTSTQRLDRYKDKTYKNTFSENISVMFELGEK